MKKLATSPPSGLAVVVVSEDTDYSAVEDFFGGPPDPVLHLRLDHDKGLFDAFRVKKLPTSVLVVDGQLLARFDGARDWSSPEIRSLLDRLIRDARTPELNQYNTNP